MENVTLPLPTTDKVGRSEYNLSPSGEDTYSLMAVFIHALVSAWWKLLLHPDKVGRSEFNLSPSGEDMYSLMAVFICVLVSAWWKLLPHPRLLLTGWAGLNTIFLILIEIEYNLSPSGEDTYSLMAVFMHVFVSVWWKMLPNKVGRS
jgi:hypothetical protein